MAIENKHVFILYNKSISLSAFHNVKEENNASIFVLKRNKFFTLFNKFSKKNIRDVTAYLQIKREKVRNCILWFDNESVSNLTVNNLNKLKNKNNKIFLFLIDELHNDYSSIANAKKLIQNNVFDDVYTYSNSDAKQYGFKQSFCYYSKLIQTSFISPKYDVFFIGNAKKRIDLIKAIDSALELNDVSSLFLVSGDTTANTDDRIKRIKYIYYTDSLREMNDCKCILDIVDNNNKGQSLRYFEAVVYNKKLLTNNPYIVNLPLYNKKYMRIFKTVEDIDFDWIKQNDKVDYGYNGEFEPKHLLF